MNLRNKLIILSNLFPLCFYPITHGKHIGYHSGGQPTCQTSQKQAWRQLSSLLKSANNTTNGFLEDDGTKWDYSNFSPKNLCRFLQKK